jgi:hypothetical protein
MAIARFESPGDFAAARSTPSVLKIPFAQLAQIAYDDRRLSTLTSDDGHYLLLLSAWFRL